VYGSNLVFNLFNVTEYIMMSNLRSAKQQLHCNSKLSIVELMLTHLVVRQMYRTS